jgi:hypothetical protein
MPWLPTSLQVDKLYNEGLYLLNQEEGAERSGKEARGG